MRPSLGCDVYELATLLVLGMKEREISRILFKGQAVMGIIAIVIGIPVSFGLLFGYKLH